MQAGKVSYAEFARSEAKREANRLRDRWKKDPWAIGSTIDLGVHEAAFQQDLANWVGAETPIPPAILDWLRWRYRRLQIDRDRGENWARLLRDEVPRRLRDVGAPPAGWEPVVPALEPAWRIEASAPISYKRARLDRPRNAAGRVAKALPAVSKPTELDPLEVANIVKGSAEVLRPLLERCASQLERDQLITALVEYVKSPTTAQARDRWLSFTNALRVR